jgi:hypothetical protein
MDKHAGIFRVLAGLGGKRRSWLPLYQLLMEKGHHKALW